MGRITAVSNSFLLTLITINLSSSVSSVDQRNKIKDGVDQMELKNYRDYINTIDWMVTGENYVHNCRFEIDRRKVCLEFGPSCEITMDWSYPEHLVEATTQGLMGIDGRVRIQKVRDEFVPHQPDVVIYGSKLYIQDIGYTHRGLWSCNLKIINRDTGRMESLSRSFTINVKENGEKGIPCIYDDQCSSFNCTMNLCICNSENPIEWEADRCFPAPKIGEKCRIDADCSLKVKGATCQCPDDISEDECQGRRTCQCDSDEVPVNLGLQQIQCMKKVRMGDKCQRSAQCEAIDPDTYCTFKGECRCKDGRKCREPGSVPCSMSSDCGPKQYCSKNRCRVRKTLRSLCRLDQECQENAHCSQRLRICICKGGYKESTKAVCIPEKYCENKLDCKDGYCENNECRKGVSLGGECDNRKHCQAIDENSICERDSRTCTCTLFYKTSTRGICIPDDRCLEDADCQADQNKPGKCLLNECIYPRALGEACDISDQCLLQTNYSVCMGECRCLNPTDDQASVCNPKRSCKNNEDCLEHQICHRGFCACEDNYRYFHDGLCYKMRPSPLKEDSFLSLLDAWKIELFVASAVIFFALSFISLFFFYWMNHKPRSKSSLVAGVEYKERSSAPISIIYRGQ